MNEQIAELAVQIEMLLPEGYGFALLTFPLGDSEDEVGIVSNADDEELIEVFSQSVLHLTNEKD